jgi:hypothetical protein
MIIGYKKIAGAFMLHFYEVPQGAKVVTEVQITSWPDAA